MLSPLQRSNLLILFISTFSRATLSSEALTDTDVLNHPELYFADQVLPNVEIRRDAGSRSCKVLPGDQAWPSTTSWNVLNATVGGQLVKSNPIAGVCYAGQDYNATACSIVTNLWSDSNLHVNHSSSIMSVLYQGLSCLYTSDPTSGNCTLGGYPIYVVNAQSPRDVQAAVNFARNTNIRLIIKNTGHDINGKSSGAGSLGIRTHALAGVQFIPSYSADDDYDGPALRVSSGTLTKDLYAAAAANNVLVVGGVGKTVGWGGGYISGGGHSPVGSILGMAADHVLSIDVVTADGRLLTTNANSHSDLFWALLGGGGSTFGVITSIVVKAYPDIPVTISIFSFLPSVADLAKYPADTSNNDFWEVIRTYFTLFVEHADSGIYSYMKIYPTETPGEQTFSLLPFFAPNKTVAQVQALLQPVFDKAAQLNISISPNITQFPGFYPAWDTGFPQEAIGYWNMQLGSRLFPRDNWLDQSKFNATFEVIRKQASSSGLLAFNIAPTLAAGGNPDNSVNPAWRNTVLHAITWTSWDVNLRDLSAIHEIQLNFTDVNMQTWRDVSPGAGAYMNEGDINEPNFQQSFFGSNYARLYSIKQNIDPSGVFFAETAVGSEDWTSGARLMLSEDWTTSGARLMLSDDWTTSGARLMFRLCPV